MMPVLMTLAATGMLIAGDASARDLDQIVAAPPPAEPTEAAVPILVGVYFVTGDAADRTVPRELVDVLDRTARAFLGRPLSGELVSSMQQAMSAAVARTATPFAQISIPAQPPSSGRLQVQITLGRIGAISVANRRYFAEKQYRDALRARPGEPVNRAALDADLAWLARNRFRQPVVEAGPGTEVGTVDLTVDARESRPWAASASFDDSGTDQTDPLRVGAGLTWGNAFGRGDILAYQLSASPDFKRSVGHSLNYQSFLPWRHVLTLTGSYADIEGRLPDPFTLDGFSWSTAANYEVPLANEQAIVVGLEFKQSNNNFRFSNLPINENTTDVAQLSFSWNGQFRGDRSGTAVGVNLILSPGGLTDRNDDATFRQTRIGADATYGVLRFSLDRQASLGAEFTLAHRLQAQFATTALLGSEQLSIGGWNSVRGFDEGRFFGDQGAVLRNELGLPTVGGGQLRAQPYLFIDAAVFGYRERLAGEKRWQNVQAIGAGLNAAIGPNLSLRASWGFQIGDQANDGESSRGHIGVSATF